MDICYATTVRLFPMVLDLVSSRPWITFNVKNVTSFETCVRKYGTILVFHEKYGICTVMIEEDGPGNPDDKIELKSNTMSNNKHFENKMTLIQSASVFKTIYYTTIDLSKYTSSSGLFSRDATYSIPKGPISSLSISPYPSKDVIPELCFIGDPNEHPIYSKYYTEFNQAMIGTKCDVYVPFGSIGTGLRSLDGRMGYYADYISAIGTGKHGRKIFSTPMILPLVYPIMDYGADSKIIDRPRYHPDGTPLNDIDGLYHAHEYGDIGIIVYSRTFYVSLTDMRYLEWECERGRNARMSWLRKSVLNYHSKHRLVIAVEQRLQTTNKDLENANNDSHEYMQSSKWVTPCALDPLSKSSAIEDAIDETIMGLFYTRVDLVLKGLDNNFKQNPPTTVDEHVYNYIYNRNYFNIAKIEGLSNSHRYTNYMHLGFYPHKSTVVEPKKFDEQSAYWIMQGAVLTLGKNAFSWRYLDLSNVHPKYDIHINNKIINSKNAEQLQTQTTNQSGKGLLRRMMSLPKMPFSNKGDDAASIHSFKTA
ncbi:hypothetical protein Ddc_09893 [Ditylenchus destructor]|nr:hypothetical protein Ddc_09893 [Ditylenchus destructor]